MNQPTPVVSLDALLSSIACEDVDIINFKLNFLITESHVFQHQWEHFSFKQKHFDDVIKIVSLYDANNLLLLGRGVRTLGMMVFYCKDNDLLRRVFTLSSVEVVFKIAIKSPRIYSVCFQLFEDIIHADSTFLNTVVRTGKSFFKILSYCENDRLLAIRSRSG